jgi:xanthine dehydrogenase accessory factor
VTAPDVLITAGRLTAEEKPFALVTVVRVERPASARPGDRGLVTPDGALAGWVGGACSEPIVVREALRALADGQPRLVRIGPPGTAAEDGMVCAVSECASEGVVDVLVEPQRPAPCLAVVGDSPAAQTLAELAARIGWRISDDPGKADAIVVATMGHGDEDALERALTAPGAVNGYVGLVASARRAGVVIAELRARGLDEETLARVRSPAGLDLGPCTQDEIGVAILAELVAWRHARPLTDDAPAEAVDPVCGMTVSLASALTIVRDGVTYAFCSPGCRDRYLVAG